MLLNYLILITNFYSILFYSILLYYILFFYYNYFIIIIIIIIISFFFFLYVLELKCNSSRSWFISIVTVVPGWIRFLQCLRRYYNTHHFNPHLLNAGKYLVGIVSILLGTFAKVNGK